VRAGSGGVAVVAELRRCARVRAAPRWPHVFSVAAPPLAGIFPSVLLSRARWRPMGLERILWSFYLVLAVCTGSVVAVCAAVFWGLALACVWSGRDSLVFWRILLPFFPAPLGCCVQWHLGAYGHAF
jgi:hypothetical protein